jgi:hypothetical protein
VLRGGVTISVIVVLAGVLITFVHHREYFRSRPRSAPTSPSAFHPEPGHGHRKARGTGEPSSPSAFCCSSRLRRWRAWPCRSPSLVIPTRPAHVVIHRRGFSPHCFCRLISWCERVRPRASCLHHNLHRGGDRLCK